MSDGIGITAGLSSYEAESMPQSICEPARLFALPRVHPRRPVHFAADLPGTMNCLKKGAAVCGIDALSMPFFRQSSIPF